VAAEYLGTVFDRLHAHVFAARAEAERGQELWATLIENLPLPALLVDTDTLQVICASEQVALRLSAEGSPPAGQNIFEAIHFSYPDVIQGLIGGAGGVARLSAVRVAGELRMCQVRVQHVAQRGRRFALVIIEDITEAFCAQAALDAADYAAFVVDSNGRVLAFNRPAHGLFPGTEIGARISSLLSPDAAAHWWEPTLTARRKMHLEILQRVYQVTSSPLSLPGEEERIHVVALRPVAKAALSDTTMTVSTLAQSS
jgi:PAS domain-containing protein